MFCMIKFIKHIGQKYVTMKIYNAHTCISVCYEISICIYIYKYIYIYIYIYIHASITDLILVLIENGISSTMTFDPKMCNTVFLVIAIDQLQYGKRCLTSYSYSVIRYICSLIILHVIATLLCFIYNNGLPTNGIALMLKNRFYRYWE